MTHLHERFNRTVWAHVLDFTGAIAKWLIKLSPYVVPDDLVTCVQKFDSEIREAFEFDTADMAHIELVGLTGKVYSVLEKIPEVMALNTPKSGHTSNIFVSRFDTGPSNPDDNFIDIVALAQNITCEFADRADVECWLQRDGPSKDRA